MTFQETISAYIQERYQITPDFPFKNALLKNQPGYFPAYHMNKEHWLSLSEEIPLSQVFIYR